MYGLHHAAQMLHSPHQPHQPGPTTQKKLFLLKHVIKFNSKQPFLDISEGDYQSL